MKRQILYVTLSLIALSACTPARPARQVPPTPQQVMQPGRLSDATAPAAAALATEALTQAANPTAAPSQPPPRTPEPTSDAPTGTPTRLAALPTPIPLAQYDTFRLEMEAGRYTLVQAISTEDSEGYVFSVYVFLRRDIMRSTPRNAWVLAFYRWNGRSNTLLGASYASPYAAHLSLYPRQYRVVNWEEAFESEAFMAAIGNMDDHARRFFSLSGYTSDINRNRRPEFALLAEYCTETCVQPSYALDFFEVAPNHRMINLSRGLPGRLDLELVSEDPLVLRVYDAYAYDPFTQIRLPFEVAWNGSSFVDVTGDYREQYLAELSALQAYLDAQAGWPLSSNQVEVSLWRQLLLYQQLGLRQEGLDAFLANTDPARWPGSDQPTLCWLAMARVHVQNQGRLRQTFTLFTSRNQAFGNKPAKTLPQSIRKLVRSMDKPGADLSACQVFLQP